MHLYIFKETTSTNDLAKSERYTHGDVVWAHHQSAGRGQRGNSWSGGVGQNIAFSVVLEPCSLKVVDGFLLSQIAALALWDVAAECGVECRVKWTNDLYAGDRKMAGILIENTLKGDCIARSVVGIGFNVNQLLFDPSLPNPTSLRAESGEEYDREQILRRIVERMMEWYWRIESEQERIRVSYNERLYRRGEWHTYRQATGEEFTARIKEVAPRGELMLEDESGEVRGYQFREVEFVIEGRER